MQLPALALAASGAAPRTIRVVLDDNYPPYVFVADGKLEGILVDQWALWEKKTGIHAELHAMDWGEALRRMRAGEFDVIDTIFKTDARTAYFDFTEAYARIEVPIFFGRELSGITDIESLRGFPVGVKAGDAAQDLLLERGITTLVPFRNYESIVTAAEQHRINVFVIDKPPALYFLSKLGLRDEFRQSAPISFGEFHRAVRKGDAALLRIVENGFAAITPAELRGIDDKWFGTAVGSNGRYLTLLVYAAGGAAVLVLILVGWNWILRRAVDQRTVALRESEQRFRQVVENLEDVFWMRDGDSHRIMYVSPSYERLWGRSRESLYAQPRSWLESVHPDDRKRVMAQAANLGSESHQAVYRIVQPGGAIRWVRDGAFPIKDEQGRVSRVVGIAADITDQRRLEEQLLRTQRMEAIGALSSGIAHDLNNILAPMLLSSALLKEQLASPQQQSLVAIIERGAERGANMLRQLLIYSRGTEIQRTALPVERLLKEMAAIVRETFPRDIALAVEPESNIPPVLADATQLHQVLLNLCVNARDAMPQGGTLTLRARSLLVDAARVRPHPDAAPGTYVVLEVEDTGVGIPREIADRIFEPFFTTKGPTKGTGLGLSTVQGIVRSHGGFVTVSSESGQGSRFQVYLPAARALEPTPARASNPPFQRGGGELVLVVDDEPPILVATSTLLQHHGYSVLTAANGSEALALLVEHRSRVRAILTDVMMPVMGGVDFVRAARTIDPRISVLVTTGLDNEASRGELQKLGVTEILMKPCAPRDLFAALHRVLDRGSETTA